LALLALLALFPARRTSREKLLALLWPETDEERSRHALSNAIYALKRALGEDSLATIGDDVGLNTDVVAVDALDFETAVEDRDLVKAVSLYAGPFMDGVHLRDSPEFEKWVDGERDRLARLNAKALEDLAEQASGEGRNDDAVEWLRRLAAVDPFNSKVALKLMRALGAAGNPAAAIQHARLHRVLIQEELGAHPDPAIEEFAARLLSEKSDAPAKSSPPAPEEARVTPRRVPSIEQEPAPQVAEVSEREQPDAREEPSASRLIASRWLMPTAVLGLLVVVLILSRTVFVPSERAPETSLTTLGLVRDRPSVAVLPFDNFSPNDEDAYLADGMHEEIITRLSKISGLIVISRSSVMRYRDHGLTGPQIAAELSVSALLEGSVQKSGDQIKITAQLIDGETDAHLWGESYDREFSTDDLFDVQSEIALRIAENLRAALTPLEHSRIARSPTENLRAYELYLRGRRAYDLYQSGENAAAIDLYRQALELDPEFSGAWAGLADAYAQGILLYGLQSSWWDSAQAASQRAISLDPDRADGYKALGLVHTSRGAYRPALEAFLKAVEIDPNHPTAAANVSVVLMRFGSLDESILWNRRAQSVGPNHMLIRANMAWNYLSLGDLETAERWAREVVALEPGLAHAHWALSAAAAARGDHATALEIAEHVIEIDPAAPARRQFAAEIALFGRDFDIARRRSTEALDMNLSGSIPPWHFPGTTLAYVLMQRDEIPAAQDQLNRMRVAVEQMIESGADDPRLPWEIGCIHAIQGEVDEALVWLERGYAEGWRWFDVVELDPILDVMRGSVRFQRLVSEMAADVERMRRQALQSEGSARLR
jgi:TolB-like protein/DNA-binding SARP family transcriptional activator